MDMCLYFAGECGEWTDINSFTHFNEQNRARMVDVSTKPDTVRVAVACSQVSMKPEVYEQIQQRNIGKGDVLAVAQIAGIMAAKKTSDIVPMCHPLPLSGIDISFGHRQENGQALLTIEAMVKTTGKTGVEMEALTAASAAGLTIYDMCKALDKGMVIGPTYLLTKTGGKSGDYNREEKADVESSHDRGQ